MELVSSIENKFDISLEINEIIKVRSARDFVYLVQKKKK